MRLIKPLWALLIAVESDLGMPLVAADAMFIVPFDEYATQVAYILVNYTFSDYGISQWQRE